MNNTSSNIYNSIITLNNFENWGGFKNDGFVAYTLYHYLNHNNLSTHSEEYHVFIHECFFARGNNFIKFPEGKTGDDYSEFLESLEGIYERSFGSKFLILEDWEIEEFGELFKLNQVESVINRKTGEVVKL